MWKGFHFTCTKSHSMGCSLTHEKYIPEDVYTKAILGRSFSQSPNTGDDTFSKPQKQILRETWKIVSVDKQTKGIAIFLEIFRQRPDAKDLFPFKHLHGEALLQNALFRSHSVRFMHAVDTTVQSLDALDLALIPVLHCLGRRHVSFTGFSLDFLPVFMNALLLVFEKELGKTCTNDVRDAWMQLAKFIAMKLTEGYEEGIKQESLERGEKGVHFENHNGVEGGKQISTFQVALEEKCEAQNGELQVSSRSDRENGHPNRVLDA